MLRDLTLVEQAEANQYPTGSFFNGMHWDDPVTESPQLGSTEIWPLINLTDDTHPMHLHLVQFQVLDRRPFDEESYETTGQIAFTGPLLPPEPNEMGWKDTVRANQGAVTRLLARFTDHAGRCVWHCHILEHEDNDLMRPCVVVAQWRGGGTKNKTRARKLQSGNGAAPRNFKRSKPSTPFWHRGRAESEVNFFIRMRGEYGYSRLIHASANSPKYCGRGFLSEFRGLYLRKTHAAVRVMHMKETIRPLVRKLCDEFETPSPPMTNLKKAAFGGMKIMVATGISFGLFIRAQAIPFTQTYVFNLTDSSLMVGPDYYTYGFAWGLPVGQQIIDAQLTFNNITLATLSQLPGGNLIWGHLLDSSTGHRRGEFSDSLNNSDAFSGKGILIGAATFNRVGSGYSTLTYDLANVPGALDALSSYVANGGFGLGIDPDAGFRSAGITFTITTGPLTPTSVPDPGTTAALLCLGVPGVLAVRRKVCLN